MENLGIVQCGYARLRNIRTLPKFGYNPEIMFLPPGEISAQSLLDQFCHFLESEGYKRFTIKNYRGDLAGLIRYLEVKNQRSFSPADPTTAALSQYRDSLVKRYMPSTVNRKLAVLKIFLRWTTGDPLLSVGDWPFLRNARLPAKRPSCPTWLEPSDQWRLQQAVESGGKARDVTLLALLLNSGLRLSEVLALSWKDVRISESQANVTLPVTRMGLQRQVPLPESARKALISLGYLEKNGVQEAVFQGRNGSPTRRTIESLINRYAQIAGLRKVTPRVLRHTFCRNLADAGVAPGTVAKLAGLRNVAMTLAYYGHLPPDLEVAAAVLGPTAGLKDEPNNLPDRTSSIDYSLAGSDGILRTVTIRRDCSTRNQDIRSLVLKRANRRCELCGVRREFDDFLEVHHIPRMTETTDRVWNCVALCPNCHRETHVSPDRDEIDANLNSFVTKFKSSVQGPS